MKNTLEMMRTIIIGYEKNLSINELINDYKRSQKPNLLAYIFVKNYGLINKIFRGYTMITEQDAASYCLQELDKSMITFDVSRNSNFISFFSICFKNRLRYEQELLMTDIRYANYCTETIDNYYDLEDVTFNMEKIDINSYGLTIPEKNQCKLLLDGYTVKEIANILNLTVQTIYNINKRIAKKLSKTL